jgi:hypothetical protein
MPIRAPEADGREHPQMAEGGCPGRRNRRHFADVQDPSLTDRYGAGSSDSRPSSVGHLQAFTNGRSMAGQSVRLEVTA